MPALFRVPIDHVLVSPGFGVSRYANSGSLGSDHLARHATLLMPDAH
jgi:endonuclease/exonuclease/phosphatase family metal-dependent hydrolase